MVSQLGAILSECWVSSTTTGDAGESYVVHRPTIDACLGAGMVSGVETLIIIAIVAFIILMTRRQDAQQQRQREELKAEALKLEAAKSEYEKALVNLKNDSCKENKIRLLEAGRYYAEIARKQAGSGGVALFDEVALQNDLTAYGSE